MSKRNLTANNDALEATAANNAATVNKNTSSLATFLITECKAMTRYSLASGDTVAPDLLASLHVIDAKSEIDGDTIKQLVVIHRMLCNAVTPATPSGIIAIQSNTHSNNSAHFLGPIPLVSHLTIITILFLCTLIGTSLSDSVNYESINHGLLSAAGLSLVLNLLFLLSCSGLGGCFSLLYKLNQFVIDANYDSKFDSTYWVRLLLGIVAGLFIVELLPKELFLNPENTTVNQFGKPALALLSGFSATMVYRVLQRLVDTIESFIKGDPKSIRGAESRVRKMQLEQHKQNVNVQQAQSLHEIISKLDSNDIEGAKKLAKKTVRSTFPSQDSNDGVLKK